MLIDVRSGGVEGNPVLYYARSKGLYADGDYGANRIASDGLVEINAATTFNNAHGLDARSNGTNEITTAGDVKIAASTGSSVLAYARGLFSKDGGENRVTSLGGEVIIKAVANLTPEAKASASGLSAVNGTNLVVGSAGVQVVADAAAAKGTARGMHASGSAESVNTVASTGTGTGTVTVLAGAEGSRADKAVGLDADSGGNNTVTSSAASAEAAQIAAYGKSDAWGSIVKAAGQIPSAPQAKGPGRASLPTPRTTGASASATWGATISSRRTA